MKTTLRLIHSLPHTFRVCTHQLGRVLRLPVDEDTSVISVPSDMLGVSQLIASELFRPAVSVE